MALPHGVTDDLEFTRREHAWYRVQEARQRSNDASRRLALVHPEVTTYRQEFIAALANYRAIIMAVRWSDQIAESDPAEPQDA